MDLLYWKSESTSKACGQIIQLYDQTYPGYGILQYLTTRLKSNFEEFDWRYFDSW